MYLKQHLQFTKNVFLLSVQVEIYGLNLGDDHISLAVWGIDPLPLVCQQPLGEMKIGINPRAQCGYTDLPKGKANRTLGGTGSHAAQSF